MFRKRLGIKETKVTRLRESAIVRYRPDRAAENLLSAAVLYTRAVYVHNWKKISALIGQKRKNPLDHASLAGECAGTAMDIRTVIEHLSGSNPALQIRAHQAAFLFGGQCHVFLVVSFSDRHYLVDVTFIQFFNRDYENRGGQGYIGRLVREMCTGVPDLATKVSDLLHRGYVELDDRIADLYGRALSLNVDPERRYPVKGYLGNPTFLDELDDQANGVVTEDVRRRIGGLYNGWDRRFIAPPDADIAALVRDSIVESGILHIPEEGNNFRCQMPVASHG